MGLKIGIIHDSPHMTWSVRKLYRSIIKLGHTPVYIRPSATSYSLNSGIYVGEDNYTVDGAIVRGLGSISTGEELVAKLGLIKSLESTGTVVINSFESLMKTKDKITQLILLQEKGVPVPETIVTWSITTALKTISKWGKAVVKPVIGSLGRGLFLVEDPDKAYYDLIRVIRSGQPIYLQRYIEKPGRDIRILVVGRNIVGGMYRVASSWKTNIAQGGTPVKLNITEELKELALRSVEVLGLEYAGIDVAEDTSTNTYLVEEVNAAPLWRGFYQATGIDFSTCIVKRLEELILESRG